MDSFSQSEVVETVNLSGVGDFVLVCEHASNFIPSELSGLGLSEAELQSHIAWDPGALAVAKLLSARLDAPLIAAKVSRLVYDCNRKSGVESAVMAESDGVTIPGNVGLSHDDIEARRNRYYQPFFEALSSCLACRVEQDRPSVIVTIHSFTPIYKGIKRELDLGILHDSDARLADELLSVTAKEDGLVVYRNAPYSSLDDVTHTLVEHGIKAGRLNVMLEIRNNLIATNEEQGALATRLSKWLVEACRHLDEVSTMAASGERGDC